MIDHTPYRLPGCADSEYVELACINRYLVDVITDHAAVHGRAIDIKADAGAEFLILEDVDRVQTRVRIDNIRKMVVLSKPRHFDEWIFEQQW